MNLAHCQSGRRQLTAARDELTKVIFTILSKSRKKARLLVRVS